MAFIARCGAVVVFVLSCTLSVPTQAASLFPPDNIGANPNLACPNHQVLAWTGNSVVCANPTPGVSVSCPEGAVLTDIDNGRPSCMHVPACLAGQTLNFNGAIFVCTDSQIPTCAANQVITFNGASFVCVNRDATVPTCAPGQFLTYNGAAFQCAGTQSLAIPACGPGQFVTANGGSLSCATPPAPASSSGAAPLYTQSIVYDYARGDTPSSYNTDVRAAIAAWPPLIGNPDAAAVARSCSVNANGVLPSSTLNSAALLDTCGQILCSYKVGHITSLNQLGGNCATTDLNCGGAGRMGFGINWNCFFGAN